MVSGLTSGLGIAGIIFIIIGIIMAVIGIVLLIARQSTSTEWYIWALLIGGIVLGIIGGIMLAIALAYGPIGSMTPLLSPCAPPVQYVQQPTPVQYLQPTPVYQPSVQYTQAPSTYQPPMQYQQAQPAGLNVAPTMAPRRVVQQQVQEIGPGNFDPDPEVSVVETRPVPQRVTAVGPYGPNGEQRTVTGVYQAPQQRVYTTEDITRHTVVNNGMGVQPGYNGAIPAPVMYRAM